MIHHSCDRCKKMIDEHEVHYNVSIEVQVDIEADEAELSKDNLEELQEILGQLDNEDCDDIRDSAYQFRKFQLCEACRHEFLENPLGAERPVEFEFSDN